MRIFYPILQLRAWVFIASVMLFVLAVISADPFLRFVLPFISFMSLFFSFPSCSKQGRILALLFLCGGLLMLLSQQQDSLSGMVDSFGSMLNLLSLFTAVPLLALPLRVGKYRDIVEDLLIRYSVGPRYFQLIIRVLSYLLSILMNVGSIPMIYSIISKPAKRYGREQSNYFVLPSIVSGYAMPLLWSPMSAVLVAVISETHIQWVQLFPTTFLLSLMGLGLGIFFQRRQHGNHEAFEGDQSRCTASKGAADPGFEQNTIRDRPSRGDNEGYGARDDPMSFRSTSQTLMDLRGVGFGIAALVIVMILMQIFFKWPTGAIVALVSLPFSLTWSVLIHKGKAFLRELVWYRSTVQGLGTTFAVFTCAGFFVTALSRSKYNGLPDHTLLGFFHVIGPIPFLACIPCLILVLSMLGFHPVISITLLSGILHPSVLHLSRQWLSVGLVAGGVSSLTLSPFMATLTVSGNISGEQPSHIMRWTAGHTLLFMCLCDLIACIGQAMFH